MYWGGCCGLCFVCLGLAQSSPSSSSSWLWCRQPMALCKSQHKRKVLGSLFMQQLYIVHRCVHTALLRNAQTMCSRTLHTHASKLSSNVRYNLHQRVCICQWQLNSLHVCLLHPCYHWTGPSRDQPVTMLQVLVTWPTSAAMQCSWSNKWDPTTHLRAQGKQANRPPPPPFPHTVMRMSYQQSWGRSSGLC